MEHFKPITTNLWPAKRSMRSSEKLPPNEPGWNRRLIFIPVVAIITAALTFAVFLGRPLLGE